MERITLHNGSLEVEISPMGAELQRIRDENGIDRLWDGDPAFWGGRAPILFPIAGALKDDAYTLDGKRYSLSKHGFARRRVFAVESNTETEATFLLTGEAGYDPGFPFDYALRARYSLDGHALIASIIVENRGDTPFWFGGGAHEAYACPEGIEAYEIVFDQPEQLAHGLLDGSFLTGEKQPIPTEGRVLRMTPSLFENDSLVFGGHRSRGLVLRSTAHRREVRVDFVDYDYLLIWTMPGAGYLCIEPWSNLPDAVDADGDITRKPGMLCLAAGETRTLTHTITFT